MEIVFEDNCVVVSINGFVSDIAVYSFSPWTKTPPAPAFGIDFIDKKQISGVFFQSKANDWWNNASMNAALDRARGVFPAAKRRIAFGSSMGAFGALVFGPALACSDYIAISPQASIDRRFVPWETRWPEDALVSTPNDYVAGAGLSPGATVHLIYDHLFHADRLHVDLIAGHAEQAGAQVCHWRFGLSGHPTGQALVHTGLLSKLIMAMFEREADYAGTLRQFRNQRAKSRAVALALLTNRRLISAHPRLVRRAVDRLRQHQTFDAKLTELLARLEKSSAPK